MVILVVGGVGDVETVENRNHSQRKLFNFCVFYLFFGIYSLYFDVISIKNHGNSFFQNHSDRGVFPSVFLLFVRFFIFSLFKNFGLSADCRLFGGKRDVFSIFLLYYTKFPVINSFIKRKISLG